MICAPRLAVSLCLVATTTMLASTALLTRLRDTIDFARPEREPGNRELRRTVDARVVPYSALGRIKGTMLCTAAVVQHPRIALTAAHCVQANAPPAVFQLGYQGGTDLGRFRASVWAIGAQQPLTGESVLDASNDWAVLLLDRASTGIRPLLLSELSAEGLRGLGRQILLPSYAVDVAAAQVLSLDPACSVRKLAWHVLVHDCRASAAGSGAPLLVKREQGYAVVGVHTGAILERDEALHVMRFVGNEATGAWTFAHAIHELSEQLNKDGRFDVAAPLAH